jgi:hypothetical protein
MTASRGQRNSVACAPWSRLTSTLGCSTPQSPTAAPTEEPTAAPTEEPTPVSTSTSSNKRFLEELLGTGCRSSLGDLVPDKLLKTRAWV